MSVHVVPVDDLIQHESTDQCVCGPSLEPVQRPDGDTEWLHVHHSLDGRERQEEESSDAAAGP